jgi:hypothetical protein
MEPDVTIISPEADMRAEMLGNERNASNVNVIISDTNYQQ